MTMNHPALIHISHLCHRYAKATVPALDDLSLSIPQGCNFALLGPNGAGKTTLLSILTGLQAVQSGSVSIAGKDVDRNSRDIKSISALVPQDLAFYLRLSGRENLRFFADVYGLTSAQWRERLDYSVNVCRLQEMLDKRVARYSGGMKRRLNMAIGLLNAPQILYLDEPTVGIDVLSRQVIIEAIQALRAQSTTVIYTSHYMEEVEALCDEVAIINHGRLVARDSTANLLQQGVQQTLLLRFTQTPSPSALQSLQKWQPRALQAQQYELSLPQASDLEAVMQLCNAQQLEIKQAQFGISRLERIYLSLLQNEASVTEARS
jgi:ABC-2 type transport system ATP-binding protein